MPPMTPSHYRDLRLHPQSEIPTPLLMSRLFQELHYGIVRFGPGHLAISFPEAGVTLGSVLRLHGDPKVLDAFGTGWATSMRRMFDDGGVKPAPDGAPLKVWRRLRVDGGPAWRRRFARRNGLALLEAQPEYTEPTAPFVQLASTSTGQKFKLHLCTTDAPTEYRSPDSYGLGSTVPAFE